MSLLEPLSEELRRFEAASETAGDESLSLTGWKTIATHVAETAAASVEISESLGLPSEVARVLELASRWHDLGKAHPAFRNAILEEHRSAKGGPGPRLDLAKAPEGAWRRPPYPERPGFRHELASGLALLELLRRTDPEHPGLLGEDRLILEAMGVDLPDVRPEPTLGTHVLAQEIAALSAAEFDLLLFLVVSHHGKVRCTWASTPSDQQRAAGAINGVCEGDSLPSVELPAQGGARHTLPELTLSLSAANLGLGARYGRSWADRVAGLLERHGPFRLAFLEALLRAADVRASRLETEDPVLLERSST